MLPKSLLAVLAVLALSVSLGAAPAPAKPRQGDDAAATATAVAWQRIAIRTIYTEGGAAPPVGTLYLAFTSLAVDDAVAGVARRGGSARAAVATAAHDVLVEYFPSSSPHLGADLETELAAIPNGPREAMGTRIGRRAATRMIASREDDGRDDLSVTYSKPPTVGYWQPADPAAPGGGMLAAWLGFVDPLVSVAPVQLDGPDPLTSRAYAADYQEVLETGSSSPTADLADEALTARFFAFNPPVMYRLALCDLLTASPMELRDTTRLFATIDAAVATAVIETSRLKLEVGFWRPFQAINDPRDDGNPATTPQPGWQPLIPNPPYSDYTSGHASATAPFAEVLRRTFGDDLTLTLTSPGLPEGQRVRTYTTLSDLEHDAFHARIWGGLHFRDAMDDGYLLGHKTARRVIHAMRRGPHPCG